MLYIASQKLIDSYDDAFRTLTIACLILMVGIMAALVLFAFKYHRSRHPKPARIEGNMKLEVIWTIIPTLISAWMFWVGYEGFQLIRTVPEGAYEVTVTAKQWSWTFEHPKYGVVDSELVVPEGQPIKCNLHSPVDDVLHSFYIPHYKVKEDCVPGVPTYLWFEGDVGTYRIFCAEFCGNDHAKMITWLKVLPRDEWEAYIEKKMKLRLAPVTDVAHVMTPDTEQLTEYVPDVKALYATYCQSCHGANGEGGLVEGARSFRDDPVAKWKAGVSIPKIFKTLTNGLPGTRMNAFDTLSAWERFALAHYVASFSKEGASRSDAPAEAYEALVKEFKLDEQKSVVRDFDDKVEEAIDKMAKSPKKK